MFVDEQIVRDGTAGLSFLALKKRSGLFNILVVRTAGLAREKHGQRGLI